MLAQMCVCIYVYEQKGRKRELVRQIFFHSDLKSIVAILRDTLIRFNAQS